jgi:hypothetical protein
MEQKVACRFLFISMCMHGVKVSGQRERGVQMRRDSLMARTIMSFRSTLLDCAGLGWAAPLASQSNENEQRSHIPEDN